MPKGQCAILKVSNEWTTKSKYCRYHPTTTASGGRHIARSMDTARFRSINCELFRRFTSSSRTDTSHWKESWLAQWRNKSLECKQTACRVCSQWRTIYAWRATRAYGPEGRRF